MSYKVGTIRTTSACVVFFVLVDAGFHTAALLADHIDTYEGWDCTEVRQDRKTGSQQLIVRCTIANDSPAHMETVLESMAAEFLGSKDK